MYLAVFFGNSLGMSTYLTTKHAVKALSECTRQDFAKTPIRITEVRPGKFYIYRRLFSAKIYILKASPCHILYTKVHNHCFEHLLN